MRAVFFQWRTLMLLSPQVGQSADSWHHLGGQKYEVHPLLMYSHPSKGLLRSSLICPLLCFAS